MDGIVKIVIVKNDETPVLNAGDFITDNETETLYVGVGDKLNVNVEGE